MLYTTKLYTGASKGFAGMLNFNSIMENSKSQFDSIATADIVVPNIISDFFNKNNTLEVYKNNGIESFDDYIIEVFTHIIIVSVAFLLIFIVAYFIFNLLRIIIMPHINIVSFGIADSIIACILGFVKGVIIIFLGCAFVPVSFIQFNYATIYNMICSSPALLFFYNNNIIIKSLLNGINLS